MAIGQGAAQVVDSREAVRAGYDALAYNLELTNQVLNNAKKTKQEDWTQMEALDAEASLMDAQEIDNDITIARDWYAEQIQAGRNVNTPKFRNEFRQKMSGLSGKVNSIKGMRTDIQGEIDNFASFKDPYQDTEAKRLKLMEIRQARPDNWRFQVQEVIGDSSGYKLGDKSKDVAMSMRTNLKTVDWERPVILPNGQISKDGSGAMVTETTHAEYNPFFEDFDAKTGKIIEKTQLDTDTIRTYLSDNPDHANALQTKRVDVQDDIIQDKIDRNEPLTEEEIYWSDVLTPETRLQKVFNDDMIKYSQLYGKQATLETGIDTKGRGPSASYYAPGRTAASKSEAIANTATQFRGRGLEALNLLQEEGITPRSYKKETGVDAATGRPTITMTWETSEQKFGPQEDDEGNVIYDKEGKTILVPIGKLKDTQVESQTFFADDDQAQAMFMGDKRNYSNLEFEKSDIKLGDQPEQIKSKRALERIEGPPKDIKVKPEGEAGTDGRLPDETVKEMIERKRRESKNK